MAYLLSPTPLLTGRPGGYHRPLSTCSLRVLFLIDNQSQFVPQRRESASCALELFAEQVRVTFEEALTTRREIPQSTLISPSSTRRTDQRKRVLTHYRYHALVHHLDPYRVLVEQYRGGS